MSLRPITLTHARLRAAQGDRAIARRICRALLELRPDDARAQELLDRLDREAEPVAPPSPEKRKRRVDPAELKERFRRLVSRRDPRVERLERWLSQVSRASGPRWGC